VMYAIHKIENDMTTMRDLEKRVASVKQQLYSQAVTV